MASPSGTSSMILQNSGSEEELQVLMDQRKRKRMISNRESARRSRMKKQKHFDELGAQVAHLKNQNQHILTTLNHITQRYLNVEAQNSVLRAQVGELRHRLQSLNEIIDFFNATNGIFEAQHYAPNNFFNPFKINYINQPEAMLQY